MKRKIWTYGRRPFVMGGKVDYVIGTEVEITEERTIRGIPLFLFSTPNGDRVAEGVTGGIVGDNFEEVEVDLQGADPDNVKAQLKRAEKEAETAEMVSVEKFFEIYKQAR